MNESAPFGLPVPGLVGIALVAIVVLAIIGYRRRNRPRTLESVLNNIAFERIEGLIIPKADEGEIQIDHLVLTAQGLLIIGHQGCAGRCFRQRQDGCLDGNQ